MKAPPTNKLRKLFYGSALFFSLLFSGTVDASPQKHRVEETNDMLAAASVFEGHDLSRACIPCHSFDKGGPNQVGPNLFGIVGGKHAHDPNYAYSDAMLAMKERVWTVDELDKWLKNPAAYAPRTKMTFSGILDPQDRMDLIAFLMTLK